MINNISDHMCMRERTSNRQAGNVQKALSTVTGEISHQNILRSLLMASIVIMFQVPGRCQITGHGGRTIKDTVYLQDIHTVLLQDPAWELSLPVIELHSSQRLELLFDDLSDEQRDFSYTLLHCDSEWIPSDAVWQQYLRGFNEGNIREIRRSFGSTRDYVNYRLVFPEENMVPEVSGNYALVVYERGRPDRLVLTRRFYVLERIVEAEGKADGYFGRGFGESGQQIGFTVSDPSGIVKDAMTELHVVVMQNGRPDRSVQAGQPRFIAAGRFDYSFPDRFIFEGGNEFRSFDIKSMKYQTERIARIEFRNPYYHIWLKPDESRRFSPYFFKEDLNGAYFIDRENADDKHLEADYVYVHFQLEPSGIPGDEQLFVTGLLSGWVLDESHRMTLNNAGHYELTLLLKQGLYDYAYTAASSGGTADEGMYEGNHSETENRYAILVYYHNMRERLDQLIGFSTVNTP